LGSFYLNSPKTPGFDPGTPENGRGQGGGIAPCPFKKGATLAEVPVHKRRL